MVVHPFSSQIDLGGKTSTEHLDVAFTVVSFLSLSSLRVRETRPRVFCLHIVCTLLVMI